MQPAAILILVAILVVALAVVAAVVKYFLGGVKPREPGKLKKLRKIRKGKEEVFDHIPLLPDGSSERVFAILSKKMASRDANGAKIADSFVEAGKYEVTNAYRSGTDDKLLADLQIETGVTKTVYVYDGAPVMFTLVEISSEEGDDDEPD